MALINLQYSISIICHNNNTVAKLKSYSNKSTNKMLIKLKQTTNHTSLLILAQNRKLCTLRELQSKHDKVLEEHLEVENALIYLFPRSLVWSEKVNLTSKGIPRYFALLADLVMSSAH